jgi:hypothetical protein
MNSSVRDVTWGGGKVGANAPAIIFLHKTNLVSQECVRLGRGWGKRVYLYYREVLTNILHVSKFTLS